VGHVDDAHEAEGDREPEGGDEEDAPRLSPRKAVPKTLDGGVGLDLPAGEQGREFFGVLGEPKVAMALARLAGSGAARSARSSTAFIARRSEALCSTAVRSAPTRRSGRPAGVEERCTGVDAGGGLGTGPVLFAGELNGDLRAVRGG
jgi:hypothetical protein